MTRRSSGRWTCTKTWWWRARSPRTRSTRWTECRASLLPSSTWSRWAHALTFIYTLLALIPITAHKISFFFFFLTILLFRHVCRSQPCWYQGGHTCDARRWRLSNNRQDCSENNFDNEITNFHWGFAFFFFKNVLSVQASNPELPCALVNCGGHFSL